MKKVLFGALALAVVLSAGYVFADNLVSNSDCGGHRQFMTITCPEGYRVQGLAQSDMKKDGDGDPDMLDAISPVCRSVSKGNDMYPADFQRKPLVMMCDKTEIMIGIACKDMAGGSDKDVLDACTAICQNPSTKAERQLANSDFDNNTKRNAQVTKIYLPNRITGIAYKDRDKNDSDKADCATVTYKHQPIVGQ